RRRHGDELRRQSQGAAPHLLRHLRQQRAPVQLAAIDQGAPAGRQELRGAGRARPGTLERQPAAHDGVFHREPRHAGARSQGRHAMSAYVVVQVDVKDPVRYEAYRKMVPASLEKFGGRFIVRGGATHTMEGNWAPRRFVIVEFPSVEQAKAWWGSPE